LRVAAVLLGDPQRSEEVFEGVLPAAEPGDVDASVVGEGGGGMACSLQVVRNSLTTMSPVTGVWTVQLSRYREWSSSQFRISTSVSSARRQWVKSDCQHSLGWAASKRW